MQRFGGDLSFSQEVHGESFYQDALAKACTNRKNKRENVHVIAVLIPEPNNKKDPHAIRVDVGGMTVGYMPRGYGKPFKEVMRKNKIVDTIECVAEIRGGFTNRDGEVIHHGIWLDLPGDLLNLGAQPSRSAAATTPKKTASKKKGCGCTFMALAIISVIGVGGWMAFA